MDSILGLDHIRGYCYTQLTDVEQKQNGIYNYDRTETFDMKRVAAIFRREPANTRKANLRSARRNTENMMSSP